MSTANAAVYGELGRYPISVLRNIRLMKYLLKLSQSPQSLAFKLFSLTDRNGHYVLKWTQNIKALIDELGFSFVFNDLNSLNQHLPFIVRRIYDQHVQSWSNSIETYNKLNSYNYIRLVLNLGHI